MPKYWGNNFSHMGYSPKWVKSKRRRKKVEKTLEKSVFIRKKILNLFFCIYLLVIPNNWGKQIFAHGIFPEVGQKQKTEKKKTQRW